MLLSAINAAAQSAVEDYSVYTEHPRLLLQARRLRLLKRERERQSPRWTHFETLMRGKAQMPEAAFAGALYAAIAGDAEAARTAIGTALRPGTDIRQVALTLDWCEATLTESQRAQLRSRLERSLKDPVTTFAGARDRGFAAIVLGDAPAIRQLTEGWWRATTAPALRSGLRSIEHADV
ncbi:MAG: hypothetical protein H7Y20_00770, partial [Bryobacteraceae bacterium]|nr:hypothetical protein [Bryobacteraceae bacterium]